MKILCVCGFGCGSSMILKMSLDKVCRQMGVECETETTDINSVANIECDAIFTSAELAENLRKSSTKSIYCVKKYMDLTEVKEVFEQFLADRN